MALNHFNDKFVMSKDVWGLDKRVSGWTSLLTIDKDHLKKLQCDVQGIQDSFKQDVVLFKPKEFMNFSGSAVKKIVSEMGAGPADILVIHDDVGRKLGAVSAKESGSANGHNGIRSVIASLKTHGFVRLRVGIGKPDATKVQLSSFVLGKFTPEELSILNMVAFPQTSKMIGEFIIQRTKPFQNEEMQ